MRMEFIQDFALVLLIAGISGAICRRCGASVTIGYLLAGIVVGPYTPPVDLVSNIGSIQTLSQLGLIFLMFSIGMSLSLRKIGQLGVGLLIAVACSSFLLITFFRVAGGVTRAGVLTCLFVAGMLVSSSSAIIGRILYERGLIHRHAGQTAMTFTLLEDLAAVILFSMVGVAGAYVTSERIPFIRETGTFLALLVFAGTIALLLVPRFLSIIQRKLPQELQILLVAGILCLLSLISGRAGYSPALGAFLLGMIVAVTPQRAMIERSFMGLRDIFSAVFFVSIGMLIDVNLLADLRILLALPLLAAGAIIIRMTAVIIGLFLAGFKARTVLPAALALTATGEFSFIFAQAGAAQGILPEYAQVLAVGVCVLTAAFASYAVPHGERLTAFLMARQPVSLARAVKNWQSFIQSIRGPIRSDNLWRFLRRRFVVIVLEMMIIAGLLLFAEPLYMRLVNIAQMHEWQFAGITFVFWLVFGIILLLPLIAVWRHAGAVALFCAQWANQQARRPRLRPAAAEYLLKTAFGAGLAGWLFLFWPLHLPGFRTPLVLLLVLALIAVVFWRKMVFWHSILEDRVYRTLHDEHRHKLTAWGGKAAEWNVELGECILPDGTVHGGRSIAELALRSRFRCSIIALERQGFLIMNPRASFTLYPQDKLLLLGSASEIEKARGWLLGGTAADSEDVHSEDIQLEEMQITENSPIAGQSLMKLSISRRFGVQIMVVRRAGKWFAGPKGTFKLEAGDEILVLGLPDQILAFNDWLSQDNSGQDAG